MERISEVMTREVQSVSPRESIRRAAQMMDDLNVGALPVCDGGRLLGMVTDRDITVRATSAGMSPDDTLVEQVMSTDVRFCYEDQSLEEVMQQMGDIQIRRIPVLSRDEGNPLTGIVSLGDLATRPAEAGINRVVQQVVEKVSFPSEPDLSTRTGGSESSGGNGGNGGNGGAPASDAAGGSDTGTATGIAGSDMVDDRLNPRYEVSATADPSDVVEVTPQDLVNRNAPGSTTLINPTSAAAPDEPPTVIHRTATGGDSSTGETGSPGGTDAAGAVGASGGTAGVSGSAGTGVGAKP